MSAYTLGGYVVNSLPVPRCHLSAMSLACWAGRLRVRIRSSVMKARTSEGDAVGMGGLSCGMRDCFSGDVDELLMIEC